MRLWPHFSFREALARRCACACRAGLLAFGCVVLLVPVNEEWLAEAQESKERQQRNSGLLASARSNPNVR